MAAKKGAFTVIEILVVISIFIIIAGIVVVRFDESQKTGRDSVRVKDLGEVANALENYYTKNNDYPSATGNFQNDLQTLVSNGFIGAIPKDPTNQSPYFYSYCRYDGKYVLMAKLESNNQALQGDYDKDWPDIGTACDCNGNGIIGDTTVEVEQTSAPYTYCIKNP